MNIEDLNGLLFHTVATATLLSHGNFFSSRRDTYFVLPRGRFRRPMLYEVCTEIDQSFHASYQSHIYIRDPIELGTLESSGSASRRTTCHDLTIKRTEHATPQ